MLHNEFMIYNLLWIAVLFVWVFMILRMRANKENNRTQLAKAIIEKNPDAGNVEDMMRKLAPRQKSLKEKLLAKLLWGSVFAVLGICFLGYALLLDYVGGTETKTLHTTYFAGFCLLAIAVAFLLNYFISKKMLAKEIEAEEKAIVHNS